MVALITFIVLALTMPAIIDTTEQKFHNAIFPKIEIPNLVTNGDFSNGFDGWPSVGKTYQSIENGRFKINTFSSNVQTFILRDIVVNENEQMYINFDYEFQSRISGNIQVSHSIINTYNGQTFLVNSTNMGIFDKKSFIFNARIGGFRLLVGFPNYGNGVAFFDNFIIINVSTLMNNKQESTMFNTTFDLMTDEQRKLQLDYWVENNFVNNKIYVELPPNFDVDLSEIGNILVFTGWENFMDYLDRAGCLISRAGSISTAGWIKEPAYCRADFKLFPFITDTAQKIWNFLRSPFN